MAEFDLVVRGGTLIDGTGAPGRRADVAVQGGRIADVGRIDGRGTREVDADGALVLPGFVDIHTHYDGQAMWDSSLTPSAWHGVTTLVMGNCGVGFAPVRPADHDRLIELMEGVEDIPGTALHEGLDWSWDSFPTYLDALERRRRDVDIATQVPHGPLRLHVMGERGANREAATVEDIAAMAALASEAVRAGALGFTTSRTVNHKSSRGEHTPSLTAAADELVGIASALGALGTGVLQVISDFDDPAAEFAILRSMAEASGRPLSVSLMQSHVTPDTWRDILSKLEVANAAGLVMRAQVGARGIGVVLGLSCRLHPFMACPSFAPWRDLAPVEMAHRMGDPELRARVLAEAAAMPPGLLQHYEAMFELADPPDYEPAPSSSIAARAAQQGRPPDELAWDVLRSSDGTALLYAPVMNYSAGNLDAVGEMLAHPNTVPGLSDGGAHVGTISDASFPTTLLAHWGRDRARGRIDLPLLVARQSRVRRPEMVADLPAGGHRLLQRADGYLHTFVAGTETFAGGQATGARPGRLIRGAQPGPRQA